MNVLLIDHQDSFVYNLYQQLVTLGVRVTTLRGDATLGNARAADPDALVLSPGPGSPADRRVTGLSQLLLAEDFASRPVFGVCLGHQLLGMLLGGRVVRAIRPVHGETALVRHEGAGIFRGVTSPFAAARYHSLVVAPRTGNREFAVTAHTTTGVPMALEARRRPWFGVQFHPESYLTPIGDRIVANFLAEARR